MQETRSNFPVQPYGLKSLDQYHQGELLIHIHPIGSGISRKKLSIHHEDSNWVNSHFHTLPP